MANAVHARVESVKLVADQSQPSLSYVAAVVQHDVLVADSPMDTMLLNLASYHVLSFLFTQTTQCFITSF